MIRSKTDRGFPTGVRIAQRGLAIFLAITAFAFIISAQSNTGNLTGTISDSSGVIPGATVVIKDNATGKEKTTVTSSDGNFNFSQLDVGSYTVTVKSAGHKARAYTDVKIDIGQTYTLTATLDAGDISEIVTVTGGADIVNSANGEISTTVTGRQIVELPLNGRNPLSLVLLQAGTSSNAANNTTINGQRSSFTNITRDGINVQDNFIRANAVDFIPDRPNVDDTGEFTIVTQNAGADLGYGASQVQLVTPRGSSKFHGALYEYNRNVKFAANSFFNNFSGIKRTYLNRNQYGGKIGGPLWLPRFGDDGGPGVYKHKGYFFFAYEGFQLHQSVTANRTILLPNARNGIFTYQDSSGVTRTVNIFNTATAAGLSVPSGIDPTIAARILANLPATGNNTTLGDTFNTTGLTLPITSNQTRQAFTSRFDVDANAKNSFNLVFNYKKENNQRTDLNAQQGGGACCYTTTPAGSQPANTPFLVGAWRFTPTSALTNELRAGYQKSDPLFISSAATPAFYIQVPLINNPEIGFDNQGRFTTIKNIQDNAVWAMGNHVLKFGGSYDTYHATPFGPGAFGQSFIPTEVLGGGLTPQFTQTSFNNAVGCNSTTGANCILSGNVGTANSLLALLGGLVGSANQTFTAASQTASALAPVTPKHTVNYGHFGPYVADTWKATPTLTLNFGLRYELYTPVVEPNGLAIEAVFGGKAPTAALLDPNGTYNFVGTNLGGHKFFNSDKNNFAPVVSVAWSPNFESGLLKTLFPGKGKTVFRGGYRISYVNDEFVRAADNALAGNAGLTTQVTVPNGFASGSINGRLSAPPTFTAPALVVPRTYAQNNALAGNFGTVFGINPNLQAPSVQEINVGFEREIGFDTAIEVRFVHNQSNNLVRGLDLNQINIFSNGFLADFNRARNNLINFGTSGINCSVAANGPNCQPLQILNTATLAGPGALTNTTIRNDIQTGIPADLALFYIQNGLGSSLFLNNPNTGVVDFLTNSAKSRYNALQVEVRRRFSKGFTFQANYTFQKSLTDAPGTGQTDFEPLIDNADRAQEYGIADSDTTHVFNLNTIYELPFGKGKSFFSNTGSWMDRLVGGWQVTSIIRASTGTPFTVTDPRGLFNRAGRSGRQQAFTTLTKDQLKKITGVFKTNCGIFFIDPQVINIDLAKCATGVTLPRVAGTTAGVASLGFNPLTCGTTSCSQAAQTFPGQVFFNLAPGQKGNTGVNTLTGPFFFNWDASIIKKIRINEGWHVDLRAEAFNLLNRANFTNGNQTSINSTTFGRSTSTFSQRIVQFVARIEF